MATVYGIAGVYVAAHLPFLPSSLEDIDSVNFALALKEFDPTLHQPHPPGYPLFVALGRISLAIVSSLRPAVSGVSVEALALSICAVLAGGVAIVAAAHAFAAIQGRHDRLPTPLLATVLLASAPLFWITGLRPMSDMPGLAIALVAQAMLLRGLSNPRRLIEGALIAGLAAGVRSQTVWLTLPLLLTGLVAHRRAGLWWLVSRPVSAVGVGALAWAIPLFLASGGPHRYWTALKAQGLDDVSAVDMLWLNPTARALAEGVIATLSAQWASTPLTVMVLVAAGVGGLVALARCRRALALLAVAFGPYAVFHVLFQDPLTGRYALPLVPPLAWLAALGIGAGRPAITLLTPILVAAALMVGISDAVKYARESHPVFRAVADLARTDRATAPAVAYAHREVWRGLRASAGNLRVIEPRQQRAWMGLVEYWKDGGTAPVWFFANPDRTDLALIDPQSRRDVVRYSWAVAGRPEFRGVRPLWVDRYRFLRPGWLAGEGWSLTPETGGLAHASGKGLRDRAIEAFVLRRPGPMHAVVGGYLSESSHTSATLELTIDRVVVDRWIVTPDSRTFLRFVDLPGGIQGGPGNYATLSIRPGARVPDPPEVFIRQFDIQAASQLIYAFAEGWHSQELDPETGQLWRWTSGRSVLRVQGPAQDLQLTLRGESPLRYFDSPPKVTVMAGDRIIATFHPEADFEWRTIIPAADVARSSGAIAVETDRVYLPAVAEGTADQRRLGLRVFECRVEPVTTLANASRRAGS